MRCKRFVLHAFPQPFSKNTKNIKYEGISTYRLLFVPLQTCDTEMMSECCLVRLGGSDFHYLIANPSILFLSAAKIKRLQ